MSNTLTLRKYFLWSSHWFCDYNYYNLLYEDIKINNYMQSIFYSLKYPSSNIVIKRYVHKLIVHSTFYILFWFKRHLNKKKLFSFFRKHKRYPINHFLLKKSVYFLSKRISNKLYFFILRYRRYKINYIKYFKINISTHERHVYKKYFIEYLLKDSSIIIENNFSIFKNINLVLDNEHNLLRSSAKKRSFNGYMRYKRDYLNIKRRYKFLMNKYALVFYRIKYMDIMKKHIYSVYRVSYDSLFKYVYEYSKIRYGFSLKYLSGKKNAFVPFQNIFDINKVKEMELIPFEENGITFKDYYHNLYSYLLSHLEYKSLKGSCIDKNFLFLFFMKEHKLNEELDHPMCNEFYFSWYLYMRKYHLHFFNKLHYYIKSCNINIEYRSIKILYYYHLMFYRIHKLRCFFKRTNKSYNAKFSLKRRFKNIIFTRERVFYVEIHFSKKVNLEKIALRYSQCYFTLIRFTNYINHLIFLVNINNVNIINYTGSFVKYLPFKEESSSSNTPNFFNIKKKHLYRGAFSTYRGTSYFNNQIRKYSTLLYKKKKRKLLERISKIKKKLNLSLLLSHKHHLENKLTSKRFSDKKNSFLIHNAYQQYLLHSQKSSLYKSHDHNKLINHVIRDFSFPIKSSNTITWNEKRILFFSKFNLFFLYKNYFTTSLLNSLSFSSVPVHYRIIFNKVLFFRNWRTYTLFNFIHENEHLNEPINKKILLLLKKSIAYLYNKCHTKSVLKGNTYNLITLTKISDSIILSILICHQYVLHSDVILSFNTNNHIILLNNVIIIYRLSNIRRMHLLTESLSYLSNVFGIYYLFHKLKRYSYINNLRYSYLSNKINNKFIVNKNSILYKSRRFKYKFLFHVNEKIILNKVLPNLLFFTNKNILFDKILYECKFVNNNFISLLYDLNNKSFIFRNWLLNYKFNDLLHTFLSNIKYVFYILSKNITIGIQIAPFSSNLFYQLIEFNENIFFLSYNFISDFYIKYAIKRYSINYMHDIAIRFLLQNKSYYLYYTKYYILNFSYLFFYIELSLEHYTNSNCFLFLNYSLRWKYYLNSAKMWCEYIAYFLKKKLSIWKLFSLVKRQQRLEKNKCLYNFSSDKKNHIFLHSYRFPLKGIRITYSGNLKKAKRKRKLYYYVRLSDNRYTGKMPLKKFKFYIDYYSISVPLKRSGIGIKFWLLFDIH